MTCDLVRPELVAYHFADVAPETRTVVEAHLETCRACLREYLALKRSIELAEDAPGPSAAARARLSAAVDAELAPPPVKWAWWERPLAFALATAVVLLGISLVGSIASAGGLRPHGFPAEQAPAPPGDAPPG